MLGTSTTHFCRVKAHPSQGLLAGMKLGGVAAVGGSLLGYAGAAAIQEQVSQVAKVPPGDRDLPSNPPATTSTRTTRPSPRSTSPHRERTQRPRQRREGELWTEDQEGVLRGVDGEVYSPLLVGSFKRRGVGVLCKSAGSGGRGAEEREGLGPSLGAGGTKIGTRGKIMGTAVERLEDRFLVGESGQSTCRARRREPRRCDRLKICLSHKHLLYLICLFSFYICAT